MAGEEEYGKERQPPERSGSPEPALGPRILDHRSFAEELISLAHHGSSTLSPSRTRESPQVFLRSSVVNARRTRVTHPCVGVVQSAANRAPASAQGSESDTQKKKNAAASAAAQRCSGSP